MKVVVMLGSDELVQAIREWCERQGMVVDESVSFTFRVTSDTDANGKALDRILTIKSTVACVDFEMHGDFPEMFTRGPYR